MIAVTFGIFGLIVGSFLNVIILRYGVRSIGGRSACMSCGRQLRWHDMVPVASWLYLRGTCRACRAPISVQYPLVEAGTSILFGLVGASSLLFHEKILGCAIVGLLVAIAVYDLRHTIIPDPWVWTFNTLAFFLAFAFSLQATHSIGSGQASYWPPALLAGPMAAAPLFALWFFSRGAWMGFGDVKLALGIGWLLGPSWGVVAIFLAFVVGALVSVPLVLFSSEGWRKFVGEFIPYHFWLRSGKGFTMESEIPFGPFLIFSCIIIWFLLIFGIDPLQALL